LPFRFR